MSKYEFTAKIEEGSRGGAYVAIPDDVIEKIGCKGKMKIVAEFDGIAYRGSIVRMNGKFVIGTLKSIRLALKKDIGDEITVVLQADEEERVLEIPGDLQIALYDANLSDWFKSMPYTFRKECISEILSSKKLNTRMRRIIKTIAMVKDFRNRKK